MIEIFSSYVKFFLSFSKPSAIYLNFLTPSAKFFQFFEKRVITFSNFPNKNKILSLGSEMRQFFNLESKQVLVIFIIIILFECLSLHPIQINPLSQFFGSYV